MVFTKMKQTASILLMPPLLCCDFGGNQGGRPNAAPPASRTSESAPKKLGDNRYNERDMMVSEQIARRGVRDTLVLQAMRKVPRHLFIPEEQRPNAYKDRALPIEEGQTISQPYIVALMTELARVKPGNKVLEIGTGSGYQAAVLAEIGAEVFSIEIIKELADSAMQNLKKTGYTSVHVIHGDGYDGLEEQAPFDSILITAAPPRVPEPLKQQLKVGGRLVVPVGEWQQQLIVLTRTKTGLEKKSVIPVVFVPMTGKARTGVSQ